MNETRRSLERIERLVEVRETYVTAAEARVKEAEAMVRYFQEELARNAAEASKTREEIAYLKTLSGFEIQAREKHILSLNFKARQLNLDLDKANQLLEKRRAEWRETMKEKKIVERVQERRQQQWQHHVDVMEQKQVDEISVGRFAREAKAPTKLD